MEDIIKYLILTIITVAILYVALNGGLQIISNFIYSTSVSTVTTSIPTNLPIVNISVGSNENINILTSTVINVNSATNLQILILNHAIVYLSIVGSNTNVSVQGGTLAIKIVGADNVVNLNGTNVLSESITGKPNRIQQGS